MLTRDTMLKLTPLEDNGEVTDWGRYTHNYDYTSLVETMPVEILAWGDIGNYQGDSLVLLRGDDGILGYLVFGYGSCPVCDQLEACSSIEEINTLRKELFDSIQWGNRGDIIDYLATKDYEGEWYYDVKGLNNFLKKAGEALRVSFREIEKKGEQE